MIRQAIHIIFLSACILLHAMSVCAAPALPEDSTPALADSVIQVEDIQVTAIKQGLNLRNQPVTASVIGRTDLERRHVAALKEVSQDSECGGCPYKEKCMSGKNWKKPLEERYKKLTVSRLFEELREEEYRRIHSEEGKNLRNIFCMRWPTTLGGFTAGFKTTNWICTFMN